MLVLRVALFSCECFLKTLLIYDIVHENQWVISLDDIAHILQDWDKLTYIDKGLI